jgi:hypothetical protein
MISSENRDIPPLGARLFAKLSDKQENLESIGT